MKFLKNSIQKTKLKRELADINELLKQRGYFAELAQLNYLIYKPDEYATALFKIRRKFCPLLTKKEYIEKQITKLSSKRDNRKNNTNEFIK